MPGTGLGVAVERLYSEYPDVDLAVIAALLDEAVASTRTWFGTPDVALAEDLTRLRLDVRVGRRIGR